MKQTFKPINDKIIVERIENKETTKGGIIIPEQGKERPNEGVIIACGPGKMLDDGNYKPMQVKKGDKIMFSAFAGVELKVEDNKYLILSESDVLVIL